MGNVNKFLKKAHSAYYYYIPAPVWRLINPLIAPLIYSLRDRAFDREFKFLTLTRISGKSKNGGPNLSASVFGSDSEAAYYAKTFFDLVIAKEVLPYKVPFSKLKDAIEKEKELAEVIIVRTAQSHANYFWKNGFLVIPDQISHEMRIPDDFSEIDARFKKIIRQFPAFYDLDKIDVEISNDPVDLPKFNDEMYVPSAKKRFDETAFIYPLEELRLYCRHGALLFIKNDGIRIAGTILHKLPGKIAGVVVGVKGGDESLLRSGYLPLLYFESFRYAHSKKIHKFDLGHAKPFIRDGVLRFKKKMGASISISEVPPIIHAFYFPRLDGSGAPHFIEQNPFIAVKNNQLASVKVFTKPNPSLNEVNSEYKKASIPGIKKVLIFAPSFNEETKNNRFLGPPILLVEEPDFFSLAKRINESISN